MRTTTDASELRPAQGQAITSSTKGDAAMKRQRARRLRAQQNRERGYVIDSSQTPLPTEPPTGSSRHETDFPDSPDRLHRLLQDKRLRLAIRQHGHPDPGPLEGLCEVCGCTQDDPCINHDGHPCAWTDPTKTLCSTCHERYAP